MASTEIWEVVCERSNTTKRYGGLHMQINDNDYLPQDKFFIIRTLWHISYSLLFTIPLTE